MQKFKTLKINVVKNILENFARAFVVWVVGCVMRYGYCGVAFFVMERSRGGG